MRRDELISSMGNDSYQELLDEIDDDTPCQNGEFIEINKFMLIQARLDEQDYRYFWGCMKLYDYYGINYYQIYLELITGQYGDFSGGIDQWCKSKEHYLSLGVTLDEYSMYSNSLFELIVILQFFGISNYYGMSIMDLKQILQKAPEISRLASERIMEKNGLVKQKAKEAKVESYFNFGDFSEQKFSALVEKCTSKCKEKSDLLIDDALKLARDAAKTSYVVVFKRDSRACQVGKTGDLLNYIGTKYKKISADSVIFIPVDADYIDDVLIATMVFYDLPLDSVRPTKVNRKFATLKQAYFAYRELESWTRKTVQKAIQKNKLRVIDLDLDRQMIDKIALEKALRQHNDTA